MSLDEPTTSVAALSEIVPRPEPSRAEHARYVLLFWVHAAFTGSLFFINKQAYTHRLFDFLVLPAAVVCLLTVGSAAPTRWWRRRFLPDARFVSAIRTPSIILFAVVIYLSAITIPGLVQPGARLGAASSHAKMAVEIVLYVWITAILFASLPNFIPKFCLVVGCVAAIATCMNMGLYLSTLDAVPTLLQFRFAPIVGLLESPTAAGMAYAVMFVLSCGTCFLGSMRWHWRMGLLVNAAIFVVALLWTQARGPYLAALFGLLALVAFKKSWRGLLLLSLILAVATVIFLSFPNARELFVARSDGYRIEIWSEYIRMALQRPFLGYGQLADLTIALSDGIVVGHPHNLLLSAQVYGGLVATVSLAAVLAAGLYFTFLFARRTGDATPFALAVTMTSAGVIDFALVTSFANWLWVDFWLAIAFCLGAELLTRRVQLELASIKEGGAQESRT